MLSYSVLGAISFFALKEYIGQNEGVDYNDILPSSIAPSISLIAPAYNEEKTIVENIRSLLSLHYSNYEVILVNDGSKDNTLQKVIEAYQLEVVNFAIDYKLETKGIRGVYKSTLPALNNLIVVDKENGGKADALNVGVNISTSKYITCIDVDCILEQDALLKMIKPFLHSKKRVIATGGVIRIANSCIIDNGKITDVRVPDSFLARVQLLEYLRAFLLGRMAWSDLNGLLIISGAFGMFDKDILLKVGGYNHDTVGEDIELVVRIRRYMIEQKEPYKVCFIPDPLCWTEVPESMDVLMNQRNRWARGTIETLKTHRVMFFNRKYGILGLLSYPYWFFYEFLAPLLEFMGIVLLLLLAIFGLVDWTFFFILLAMVYSFTIVFNLCAILADEMTFYQYKRVKDVLRLIGTVFLEPLLFHPLVVWASVRGNIDFLKGKKSWGEMTRKGFSKENEQIKLQLSTG